MAREQQRMDDTIAAIEAEVKAKLHRRGEDQHAEFGNGKRRENTAIVSKLPRTITQLPRTKNTAVIIAISVLLLAALVVLIVLMLRTPAT